MRSESLAPPMLKREALADQVYERLMTDLIDGRLEPDSAMSIDGVARRLGVSPTPVREALSRLESTGLVIRLPFKGYRVGAPLSLEDLRQLSEARRAIEPINARLAAAATTRELVEALEGDIADLQRAPRGPSFADFREYWEADERFHRRIAEHTGNKYLFRAYSALGGQLQRYRLFKGRGVTDFAPTLQEHTSILEAVRAGDVERAGEAMTCHIVNVWERSVEDSKNVP